MFTDDVLLDESTGYIYEEFDIHGAPQEAELVYSANQPEKMQQAS